MYSHLGGCMGTTSRPFRTLPQDAVELLPPGQHQNFSSPTTPSTEQWQFHLMLIFWKQSTCTWRCKLTVSRKFQLTRCRQDYTVYILPISVPFLVFHDHISRIHLMLSHMQSSTQPRSCVLRAQSPTFKKCALSVKGRLSHSTSTPVCVLGC